MSKEDTATELKVFNSQAEACSSIEELNAVEEAVMKYHRSNPEVDIDNLLLKIACKKQNMLDHVCDPNKLRKEANVSRSYEKKSHIF